MGTYAAYLMWRGRRGQCDKDRSDDRRTYDCASSIERNTACHPFSILCNYNDSIGSQSPVQVRDGAVLASPWAEFRSKPKIFCRPRRYRAQECSTVLTALRVHHASKYVTIAVAGDNTAKNEGFVEDASTVDDHDVENKRQGFLPYVHITGCPATNRLAYMVHGIHIPFSIPLVRIFHRSSSCSTINRFHRSFVHSFVSDPFSSF
jgi:hypothetical protein